MIKTYKLSIEAMYLEVTIVFGLSLNHILTQSSKGIPESEVFRCLSFVLDEWN